MGQHAECVCTVRLGDCSLTAKPFSLLLKKVRTVPIVGWTNLQCLQEANAPRPQNQVLVTTGHVGTGFLGQISHILYTLLLFQKKCSCFFFFFFLFFTCFFFHFSCWFFFIFFIFSFFLFFLCFLFFLFLFSSIFCFSDFFFSFVFPFFIVFHLRFLFLFFLFPSSEQTPKHPKNRPEVPIVIRTIFLCENSIFWASVDSGLGVAHLTVTSLHVFPFSFSICSLLENVSSFSFFLYLWRCNSPEWVEAPRLLKRNLPRMCCCYCCCHCCCHCCCCWCWCWC